MKLVSMAFVVGCSPYAISESTRATMPAFGSPQADVGIVCVIRSSVFAQGVTFVVHDNQHLVGATRGHSYFCYEAAPGPHTIVSDTFDPVDQPGRAQVMIAPSTRYWLYQDHANSLGSVTSKLEWIDETRARHELEGCEYRVLTRAPGHEQIPPPVPYAPA